MSDFVADRESLTLRLVVSIRADEALAIDLETISCLVRAKIRLCPNDRPDLLGVQFDGHGNGCRIRLPYKFPCLENSLKFILRHFLPSKSCGFVQLALDIPVFPFRERPCLRRR